jgi:hypothetical protein
MSELLIKSDSRVELTIWLAGERNRKGLSFTVLVPIELAGAIKELGKITNSELMFATSKIKL